MSKFWTVFGNKIAAVLMLVGGISTSTSCRFILHQPEVPEELL